MSNPESCSSSGLLSDDILGRVYEGGFKTWECAIDLAIYLLRVLKGSDLVLSGRTVHVIEVRHPPMENIALGLHSSCTLPTISLPAWCRHGAPNGKRRQIPS